MSPHDPPVIHWFRRDLRLRGNTALNAALETGRPVIPVFIFDPAILRGKSVGAGRVALMLQALHALDESLRARGGRLWVRYGHPVQVLRELVAETNAQAVFFNRDTSPYARHRDDAVRDALAIPVHAFDDGLLVPPGRVLKSDGDPYTVFTPFKKRWLAVDKAPQTTLRQGRFLDGGDMTGPGLPTLDELGFRSNIPLPEATEYTAQSLLDAFLDGPVYAYDTGRDRLGAEPSPGTSQLSPYLRFGLLSIRDVYWRARAAQNHAPDSGAQTAVETWISELAWREFYAHILFHFPHVVTRNFRPAYDSLAWRDAPDELQAWRVGMTGYPVVDAAMRQLVQTGWMPNRARMIVASFLTKDMLIDWRKGEETFMLHLIDGDLAANNGGWQWAAGTGTDAQPYFRIFNPVLQTKKFDPAGAYIRRWVPELRDTPSAHLHAPWTAPSPPTNYPPPIVDHAFARERTLRVYAEARSESSS